MYDGGDDYDIDHFDEDEDVGCMFVMMMKMMNAGNDEVTMIGNNDGHGEESGGDDYDPHVVP